MYFVMFLDFLAYYLKIFLSSFHFPDFACFLKKTNQGLKSNSIAIASHNVQSILMS